MKSMMTLAFGGLLALAVGCTGADEPEAEVEEFGATRAASIRYIATSEPAGAIPVGKARQDVQDDQTITLVGTIGGSTEPFVDGLAAFTIVDAKVPFCAAEEGCPTPWDYCCSQAQVKDNIATVKVVDADGAPVAIDARELLDVKELSTVVVEGKAERDESGNLAVLAQKVFVRPAK